MNGARRISLSPLFRFVIALQGVVLAVGALYFAQPVLLPLAMAVLLTFLLRPGVIWLERHRIPRLAAVGVAALAVLLLIGTVGWVVTEQFRDLALHLDEYRGHMRAKIEPLRHARLKAFDNVRAIVVEIADAIRVNKPAENAEGDSPESADSSDGAAGQEHRTADEGHSDPGDEAPTAPRAPQTVKLAPEPLSPVTIARLVWGSLSAPVTTGLVVCVLVIFMLSGYEELRNRLLRLVGQSKLTVTTRTLDEAGKRISRYLVAYAAVNSGFGFLVFLGLSLIGVDYALLWGFLAALFR
ncbi:MAG TPA: AI-2E family transporter, partial [Planctomycetaceae bacterium]|nr:AI-2E family transporter [Planctomycetaceae bacterium]